MGPENLILEFKMELPKALACASRVCTGGIPFGMSEDGWIALNGENKLMLKKQWMWLFAALLALSLAGCKDDEEKAKACTGDSDCDSSKSQICHPNVKVCVKKCESGSDCPESSRNCFAISATNTQKICQCSTDALCGDDLVCNEAYKVCVSKEKDKDIGPADGIGASCDSTKPQPDICKYGLVCGSDNKCAAALNASNCSNLFPESIRDPSEPKGPIIYSVEAGIVNELYCDAEKATQRLVLTVKAYSTDARLKKGSSVPFTLHRPNGSTENLFIGTNGQIRNSDWVDNGDNHATIKVNLCSFSNPYRGGLVFEYGNTVCANYN